ncbi:hypothetical protein SLA2020_406640 [Shorea laevis]
MASQTEDTVAVASGQIDSSVLTRPGPDGVMTSVTTVKDINEKILSFDFPNCKVELLTVDAEYMVESESMGTDSVVNNHTEESDVKAALTPDPELTPVPDHPEPSKLPLWRMEIAPKKSFASVVNALKDNNAPFHLRNSTLKKIDDHAVKTYALFVPNLPMDATIEQLEVVFKEFGPIKHDGIQVRSNKQQGSCFGFVEFESANSMQLAIEASPIIMFDRKLHVEERRANNDRGRFPSGRGGYRNDNFRGRGDFNGGRGYGRNDFEKRGDFSGRTRDNGGRNVETGQRVHQNGGGRATRQASTEA